MYDRLKVADGLKAENYTKGDKIVTEVRLSTKVSPNLFRAILGMISTS